MNTIAPASSSAGTSPATRPALHRPWDARPLNDAAINEMARSLAGARVVGIGESTRFSRETFEIRERLSRVLFERHDFRILAMQDSADVAARLDRYVHSGTGSSAESALSTAWRPWQTVEMAAALAWIRGFNCDHADDPIRIIGLKPAQAKPADYDAILDATHGQAPDRQHVLTAHLDVIRSAHTVDEHVQRARGMYSGLPFLDHARAAATLLDSMSGVPDDVQDRMRLIVEFHEHSVAGRGSYAGEADMWAEAIINQQNRRGQRIVYWDGIAHTSAVAPTMGQAPERGPQPSVGSVLRERYGSEYLSVGIGFHHGNLGVAEIPAPGPDLIDATLGTVDLPAHWVDLRADPAGGRALGPVQLRTISGVYDPARDAAEYIAVAALPDAFDVLAHIRQATPVRRLS